MAGTDVEVVVAVPEVDLTDGAGGPVYVVQRAGSGMWTDICRVTAPARTKRKTIITAAVSGANPSVQLPATLRVLDAEAAHEHKVGLKKRDPELVIT